MTKFPQKICNTEQFQHSCKLASQLLQSISLEGCLLIRKNNILEVKKTVELKNVMLLVMNNIVAEPHLTHCGKACPNNTKLCSKQLSQCSWNDFKSTGITLWQFKVFWHWRLAVSWISIAVQMLHKSSHCVAVIFSAAYPAS